MASWSVKFGDTKITKKSSSIDLEGNKSKTGDPRFRRFEYWGVGTHYVLHYLGDNTISNIETVKQVQKLLSDLHLM